MLRITAKKEGPKTRALYLEGKICGEYVKELQREVEEGMNRGEKMILDLSKVVFFDDRGRDLIKRLASKSLQLRNCPLYIRTALKI